MDPTERFETLVEIMDRLRAPDGCPWDREQTFRTLRGYLVEECYEVVEALDRQDLAGLREELGDLLFQIVFLARIAKERGAFGAPDVVRGIAEKMIRRHPHVFGDVRAETSEDVLRNWEEIKREEKGRSEGTAPSVLEGIPRALPALPKAQRLGAKAARLGFDWPDVDAVLSKLTEELSELAAARRDGDEEATREEVGDVLFTMAMVARKLGIDPEEALESANRKFAARFRRVEEALADDGRDPRSLDAEILDRFWEAAKPAGRVSSLRSDPSAGIERNGSPEDPP